MSNTITIKDPNGNIVCSVENMDPIKSEEGFINKLTGYVPFTVQTGLGRVQKVF